jgi:alkylation response protein AidB-like acyl-CoA dehydrogenase
MSYLADYPIPDHLRPWREEVRAFIAQHLDEKTIVERESGEWGTGLGPLGRTFLRKLGERGWLGLTWPKEYGGLGMTFLHRYILAEEMDRARAPLPGFGAAVVGPCLMLYGSEWQKAEYLREIARGEVFFALGYTEPEAGSDLASLKLRAVEDGDDYVLTGQKIFQSETHCADYVWLAARTSVEGPKHKGLSLFIVDAKSPGMTIQPMHTLGGHRTNIVFYDGVRVPKRHLVGELNRGWYYLAAALDFERFFPVSGLLRDLEQLIAFAHAEGPDGRRLADSPHARRQLSQLTADALALRASSNRMAFLQTQGLVPNVEASILKLFQREFSQRLARTGAQMLGLYGQLREGDPNAPLHGALEKAYRNSPVGTITAGSSEIQRNVIATRGLGLPR